MSQYHGDIKRTERDSVRNCKKPNNSGARKLQNGIQNGHTSAIKGRHSQLRWYVALCVRPSNVKDKHSCIHTLLLLNMERSKVKALDWRVQKVTVAAQCTQLHGVPSAKQHKVACIA